MFCSAQEYSSREEIIQKAESADLHLRLVTCTMKLYQVEGLGTQFSYFFLLSYFVVVITKNACGFSVASLKTEVAPEGDI